MTLLQLLLLLCIVVLTAAGVALKGWTPQLVPNPMTLPAECGRTGVEHSKVCDPDNLLTKETKDVIEGYINDLASKGDKGDLSVLIINKMTSSFLLSQGGFGGGGDSETQAAEKFAMSVHDTWGVGSSSKNDGALLFLSLNDRVVYVSRGSGVKGKLQNAVVDGMIANMRPFLRAKEYGTAVEYATLFLVQSLSYDKLEESVSANAKYNVLHKNANTTNLSDDNEDTPLLTWVMIAFFVIFGLYSQCIRGDNTGINNLQRGRGALNRFMTEASQPESSGAVRFPSTSCPICLEEYPSHAPDQEPPVFVPPGDRPVAAAAPPAPASRDPKRPMALVCGHIFCFECLDAFLKTEQGGKCPVCRQPTSPTAPRDEDGSGGGGEGHARPCAAAGGEEQEQQRERVPDLQRNNAFNLHRRLELQYRLRRLQALYPSVATTETVHSLEAAITSGDRSEIQRVVRARDIEVRNEITEWQKRADAASRGSSGSKHKSFGGGRSSGGRGGRW